MNAGRWVNDVNDTSAHDVQDNGEGYNKVLIQLSAEDKLQISGWSRTLLFWSTVILQIRECTNIHKIFRNSNLNGMNESTKIWNMKHKRNKKKRREMKKEKEINCI